MPPPPAPSPPALASYLRLIAADGAERVPSQLHPFTRREHAVLDPPEKHIRSTYIYRKNGSVAHMWEKMASLQIYKFEDARHGSVRKNASADIWEEWESVAYVGEKCGKNGFSPDL